MGVILMIIANQKNAQQLYKKMQNYGVYNRF